VVLAAIYRVAFDPFDPDLWPNLLVQAVQTNLLLAFFNLIPIPPLDGSWVLMRFLPLKHILALQQFRLLGLALVMVLLSSRPISNVVLYAPLRFAVRACLGLFGVTAAEAVL
jgi:Zn-dependent protease